MPGSDLASILLDDKRAFRADVNKCEIETTMWHPNEDATPTPEDVEAMAAVLEGQHGDYAVGVAEFFARMHGQKGDAGRAWAWQGVAARINKRTVQRTGDRQSTPREVPRA